MPPPVAVVTLNMNKTYATRYVSKKVTLRAKDLARLSLLVRCKAIQYDFQNPRAQIDITV